MPPPVWKEKAALLKQAQIQHRSKLFRSLKRAKKEQSEIDLSHGSAISRIEPPEPSDRATAKSRSHAKSNPMEMAQRAFMQNQKRHEEELEEQACQRKDVEKMRQRMQARRSAKKKIFLSRTKKGQPRLNDQISCLLERIQQKAQ